jgi:hypothetical protein
VWWRRRRELAINIHKYTFHGGRGVQPNWGREKTSEKHPIQYVHIVLRAHFLIIGSAISFRSFCSTSGRHATIHHSFIHSRVVRNDRPLYRFVDVVFVARHGPMGDRMGRGDGGSCRRRRCCFGFLLARFISGARWPAQNESHKTWVEAREK